MPQWWVAENEKWSVPLYCHSKREGSRLRTLCLVVIGSGKHPISSSVLRIFRDPGRRW